MGIAKNTNIKAHTQTFKTKKRKGNKLKQLSVPGGDGAEVKGGEEARHGSTAASDKLYRAVFPDASLALTDWDLFHRGVIIGQRALKNVPYAIEIFDVSQVMDQLFGVGSGRVLHRSIATLLEDDLERRTFVNTCRGSGTRPMAKAARVCESMLRNYRTYHAGLEARMAQTRGSSSDGRKRGSQSLVKLVQVGWRLASADFVAFLMLYRDLSINVLSPFILNMEKHNAEVFILFS